MTRRNRGDPPRGNTVNRAAMDAASGMRPPPEIVFAHLMEGIGIGLDYSATLDGSNKELVLAVQGNLTGIAYIDSSAKEA